MTADSDLVLLPAAGSSGEHQADLAAALRRRARVLTPDLSVRRNRPVILEDPALTTLAAISRADWDAAALCGLGFGAMTALTVAAGFPGRVSGLVLSTARTPESTALLSLQHGWQGLLPAATAQRLGAGSDQVTGLFDQVRPSDYRTWISKVSEPALVLVGDRDVANLGPSTRLAAALPHGRLQIVSRAGAGWASSQPDRYAELVLAYLAAGG